MNKLIAAGIVSLGVAFAGHAEKIDILKPAFQRQEQDLLRLIGKWEADGMGYEIKVEKRAFVVSKSKGEMVAWHWHIVTLPPEVAQELRRIGLVTPKSVAGRSRMVGLAKKHSDAPKYSFPMAVLNLAVVCLGDKDGFPRTKPLDAIVNKDRDAWGEDGVKSMLEGHDASILYHYDWDIFSSYALPVVHEKDFLSYEQAKDLKEKIVSCINDGKRELLKSRNDFIKWCRTDIPAAKPYLPALAMGLFTINGYDFDDGTGVYTMNERGRMLMDFIAEFPIPENATRLQAVMDGGNKDEIEGMMKKHGTEAKWKELLKNPAHPAFAKYPQD